MFQFPTISQPPFSSYLHQLLLLIAASMTLLLLSSISDEPCRSNIPMNHAGPFNLRRTMPEQRPDEPCRAMPEQRLR
ncbi:hypothetical protein RchiOBHm_Chr7g0181961 [Rosa chinensis]|uniref:Secreted protein n=1 Tax=Rosa chinensis TaxID=74649 RepID=A0A2P6P2S8_ROSCH|nr:hypothetical protein RchiOBHm_Chr7g0181961 [Rosa chinensis]